jgi:CrcB protein
MAPLLLVGVGSALGGMARYAVYLWMARPGMESFPWATVIVNVIGSAVIGWFAGASPAASPDTRLFVMTGLCGGFTTFSAFSLDAFSLLRGGEWWKALAYVAAQMTLCAGSVWLGWMAAARR